MEIITSNNINQVRSKIDSMLAKKQKPIVILSQDDEFNRKLFENKKIDMVILNENLNIRDYMKQRNSGLNDVLCKLSIKNNIQIAIDINEIIKKKDIEQAKSLARLAQNIMLCKKTKCKLEFIGKDNDRRALNALFLSLGSSTSQAKKASEGSFFK